MTMSLSKFSWRAMRVLPSLSSKLTPWPSYRPKKFLTVEMIDSVVSCGQILTLIGKRAALRRCGDVRACRMSSNLMRLDCDAGEPYPEPEVRWPEALPEWNCLSGLWKPLGVPSRF